MTRYIYVVLVCLSLQMALSVAEEPDLQTQNLLERLNQSKPLRFDETVLWNPLELHPHKKSRDYFFIDKVEDISISYANESIKVRLYHPEGNQPQPLFIFFHGGSWMAGSLDNYDEFCKEICVKSNCIVAAVDNPGGVENTFPKTFLESYKATQWLADNIANYGGDSTRIAVGGDSTGGNIAAAVALMARDSGSLNIVGQVLIYPVLNFAFDTISYFLYGNGYYITKELIQYFWKLYLGSLVGDQSMYATPFMCNDFSNLPSTLVLVADFDPVRDDGLLYAESLQSADVSVVVKRYPSIHAFMSLDRKLDVSTQGYDDVALYLQNLFSESK